MRLTIQGDGGNTRVFVEVNGRQRYEHGFSAAGKIDGSDAVFAYGSDAELDAVGAYDEPDDRPQIAIDLARVDDESYGRAVRGLFTVDDDDSFYRRLDRLGCFSYLDGPASIQLEVPDALACHILDQIDAALKPKGFRRTTRDLIAQRAGRAPERDRGDEERIERDYADRHPRGPQAVTSVRELGGTRSDGHSGSADGLSHADVAGAMEVSGWAGLSKLVGNI